MKKVRVVLATALMASALSVVSAAPASAKCTGEACPVIITVCAKMDKYYDNFLGCETW